MNFFGQKFLIVFNSKRAECGATMVEFSMVALFVFFLFGFIIDLGVTLHQYSFLSHTTSEVARGLAVKLNSHTNRPMEVIADYIMTEGNNDLEQVIQNSDETKWTVAVTRGISTGSISGVGNESLTITTNVPVNCYFVCPLLPEINVSTSTTVVVESRNSVLPNCKKNKNNACVMECAGHGSPANGCRVIS